MLKGIDVSRYQRFENYQALNQSKLAFVFIKASEGTYKDPSFVTHSNGFAKTCLLKGAYHFLRFKTSAQDQARNFINVVKDHRPMLELPPVLDIEDDKEDKSVEDCEKLIQEWLDIVEAEFKQKPIIYSGGWYWGDPAHLKNTNKFNKYPLWTSRYNKNSYLPMYGGWTKPTFWQYTDKGFIDGLGGNDAAIDEDFFLGSIEELWGLTGTDSIKPSDTVNPKVEAVQYILNQKGFNTGGQPDGIFSDWTLTAYKQWLEFNKLAVEERITAKNWQLLFGLGDARPAATPSPTGPVPAAHTTPKTGIVTANKLNIRSGAGVENMMVAQPLSKGQAVTIVEEKDGWYKIKTEVTGWVTKSYIS